MRKNINGPVIDEFKILLARNLRLLRKASGLTGEEFAVRLGLSRNHLYTIERGNAYGISLESIYKIGKLTDLDTFFKEDLTTRLINQGE